MGEALDINEALGRFVRQLRANGRSPHTVDQYARHVRLLETWLRSERRSVLVAAIDAHDLALFLTSAHARLRPDGQEKKPTSMNALRSSARCFFEYLHSAGEIAANPARLIRRAICGGPPPRSLSADEQKRLLVVLAKAPDRDRVLFTVMLRTGVRVGSALALDVEDVDVEEGVLALRRMKGSGEARVPIPRETRRTLKTFLGGLSDGPLFRGSSGRRISQRHAARTFKRILERAKIVRVRGSHSLRHSYATDLLRRTGDLALVQKALCHRSITSTMQYIQVDDERLRAALGA